MSPQKLFDLGNSNSDYGIAWTDKWCERCKYGHLYWCNILCRALFGKEVPPEHIYNEDDEPVCTAFELDPNMEHHQFDREEDK